MKQIAICVLVMIAYSAAAFGDEGSANINVMYGQKQLKKEDWEDSFEHQRELGLLIDYRAPGWPVSITFEGMKSAKKITNDPFSETKSTEELCIGLKKIIEFETIPIRPFIGAGFARIHGKEQLDILSYNWMTLNDWANGYWVSGGLYWTIEDHFNIGIIARYSKSKVSFQEGLDVEAGGTHFGGFVGIHW